MKKLLLVGILTLSAVSFAKGHGNMSGMNHGNGGMMNGAMSCGMISGRYNGNHMGMNMSPELRKEMQADMIKIQEKKLEISKIMNTMVGSFVKQFLLKPKQFFCTQKLIIQKLHLE